MTPQSGFVAKAVPILVLSMTVKEQGMLAGLERAATALLDTHGAVAPAELYTSLLVVMMALLAVVILQAHIITVSQI